MSKYMAKYPFASAYVLGMFDIYPSDLNRLVGIEKYLYELELILFRDHPNWSLDEIYYRGMDMGDGIYDIGKRSLTEQDRKKSMKWLQQRLGHSKSIVPLVKPMTQIVYEYIRQ